MVAMPNAPHAHEEVALKDVSLESVDKWFTILLDCMSTAPSACQGLQCHNQAIITRHFLLSRPEVTRLEHTINHNSPNLLRIWSGPVPIKGSELRNIPICVSTCGDSLEATEALASQAAYWAKAHSQTMLKRLTAESVCAEALAVQRLHDGLSEFMASLSLESVDEDMLMRQGLIPAQIKEVGFRTWPGGVMQVPWYRTWPDNQKGNVGLFVGSSLVIPARNAEGLMTALRVKPHSFQNNSEEPRSTWVSVNQSLYQLGSCPLFCCWYMPSVTHTVALVAGDLEAYVFAYLASRIRVIGAAGGRFWNARVALVNALARMEAQAVLIFPDPSIDTDKIIAADNFRTCCLLRNWGLKVRIVHWRTALQGADPSKANLIACAAAAAELGVASALSISAFWATINGVALNLGDE